MIHSSHTMRQTSLMAYQDISFDGTVGKQASKILYAFRAAYPEGFTRNEVSRVLDIKINAVCGRIKELLDSELLEETGEKRDTFSGKANNVIRFKPRC